MVLNPFFQSVNGLRRLADDDAAAQEENDDTVNSEVVS